MPNKGVPSVFTLNEYTSKCLLGKPIQNNQVLLHKSCSSFVEKLLEYCSAQIVSLLIPSAKCLCKKLSSRLNLPQQRSGDHWMRG